MTITFIVNPVSGAKDKAAIVEEAQRVFSDSKILYTEYAGHAKELAANAGTDVLWRSEETER